MSLHEQIQSSYEAYLKEQVGVEKGVKAAATRARKALMSLAKLCKSRRQEISDDIKGEAKGSSAKTAK